jgi:hypothetical protein
VLRARPELADELAEVMSARHTELEAVRREHQIAPSDNGEESLVARIRRFFVLS